MKLHLPKGLRAALLAAICMLASYTSANATITSIDISTWNGYNPDTKVATLGTVSGSTTVAKIDYGQTWDSQWGIVWTTKASSLSDGSHMLSAIGLRVNNNGNTGLAEAAKLSVEGTSATMDLSTWSHSSAGTATFDLAGKTDITFTLFHDSSGNLSLNAYGDDNFATSLGSVSELGQKFSNSFLDYVVFGGTGGNSKFNNTANNLNLPADTEIFSFDVIKAGFKFGGAISEDELHTYYNAAASLVWDGTESNNKWNTADSNWIDGTVPAVFSEDRNVTFNETAGAKLVSISEAIQAGKITITGADYTFDFSGEEGFIMAGDLLLSGRTLTLAGEGGLMIDGLKGGGILDVAPGVGVMVGDDDIIVASDESLTVQGAGTLLASKVSSAGTATISTYTVVNTLEITGGDVIFNCPDSSEEKSFIGNMESAANTSVSLTNTNAYIKGADRSFKSNTTIGQGATVTVEGNDKLDYSINNTMTVSDGGVLSFDNARFTMGSGNKVVMAGGTISGTGDADNGALDYYQNNKLSATKTSDISAPIRLRDANVVVEVDIASEAELTLSGKVSGAGALSKVGEGTLTLTDENTYTGGTTISSGTVTVTHDKGLGNGNVTQAGGTLRVSAAVDLSSTTLSQTGGSITVAEGKSLTVGAASLTSTIENKGSVTFSSGTVNLNGMELKEVKGGYIDEFSHEDATEGFVKSGSKYVQVVATGGSISVSGATFVHNAATAEVVLNKDTGVAVIQAAAATDWTKFDIKEKNHKLQDIAAKSKSMGSAIGEVSISGGSLAVDSTDLEKGKVVATGGAITMDCTVGLIQVGKTGTLSISGSATAAKVDVMDDATINGSFKTSAFNVGAGKAATLTGEAELGALAVQGKLALKGAGQATGGTVADLVLDNGSLTTTADLVLSKASGSGTMKVQGNLTLNGAAELRDVTAGRVVLKAGSGLTLSGNLNSENVELATVSTDSVMVAADGLTASAGTNFTVDVEMVVALGLKEGETVTLATLGKAYTSGLKVNNGASIYRDGDQLCYAISQDATSHDIILTAQYQKGDYVWEVGSGDDIKWSNRDNWTGNKVPTAGDDAWVQIDKPNSFIDMDESGSADRVTVYNGADGTITGSNPLDIAKLLEVNRGGELTIGGDNSSQEVSAPDVALEGALNVMDKASLAAKRISMAAGSVSVENGGSVVAEVLTGDADSELAGSGVIAITGQGTRYLGKYAGATVDVAKGGDAVLYAGDGLDLAGAGAAQLVYTVDTVISRIHADGLDLTLNNAAADNSRVTLALEEGSALKNGTIRLGLSAEGTAGTIDSEEAPNLVSSAVTRKRSMAAPGLDLTGSKVVLTQSEDADVTQMAVANGGKTKGLVLAYLGAENTDAAVQLNGNLFAKYYKNARLQGGEILVDMNDTYYRGLVRPTTANGRAGAAMLDDAFMSSNPQQTAPDGDLAAVMNALETGAVGRPAAEQLAAAMSGASAAAMGAAWNADVERQLRAIRNRTTTMGLAECQHHEELPYFNAWMNAEGDYRKMSAENTLAGHALSSWGGTVGMDIDFSSRFTAGLAFTAMHGKFTAKSAEMAEGDLDRMYVSAFARYAYRAWTHTFVATLGVADTELKRTVDYGTGDYTARGGSDGSSFGLMYETGYTLRLNAEASTCLQPLFNISYRHSNLGGYAETGSDAALHLGDATTDVVSFGLGTRLQSVVGTSVYNRASLFEGRVLVKLDAGDRDTSRRASFLGVQDAQAVKSAEYGTFSMELGAGLVVPLGHDGCSMFFDVSADFCSGYTDVNGTVGYRFNF